MARRSRRRRHSPSKANPRSFSDLRASRVQDEESPARGNPVQNEPKAPARPDQLAPGLAGKVQDNWSQEYGRVFSDLKQLLVVSAALFAVMLVVGLFL